MPHTKRGRPKTEGGHKDDAMLDIIDFLGAMDAMDEIESEHHRVGNEKRLEHYRIRRDCRRKLRAALRSAAAHWRDGELVKEIIEAASEEVPA